MDRDSASLPLRVAFVLTRFPVTSQTFILRQITGLLDLGHDIRVLSERQPHDTVEHGPVSEYGLRDRVTYVQEPATTGPRALDDLGAAGRILFRRPGALALMAGNRSGSAGGGRRSLLRRLTSVIDAGNVDVVHCHFGNVGLRYAPVAEWLGIPLLTSFYGYDCSRFPLQHGQDVYLPLFRVASGVTVLSDQMKERLVELGCPPEAIHKQHLGVDPDDFPFRERTPPSPDRPVRLLTVARLVEKKGIAYALEAVAGVLSRGAPPSRDLRYDIVGDGPLRDSLEAKAAELGLGSRVRFHGAVNQEGVRRAMAEAHLFLLPSVTASDGDQEGTPTVLVEAACAGLPVLSTRHSGIPEIVQDGRTGFLVPERDAGALTDRLEELLATPALWKTMGRAGRRHIEEEFDLRKLNRRLESLYRHLLRPSSSGASGRG